VFVLPRSVIRGRDQVCLVEDDVLRLRTVEILRHEGESVVLRGLEDGDLVIRTPLEAPVDGMRVRTQPAGNGETTDGIADDAVTLERP
jgi:hypothetical protein